MWQKELSAQNQFAPMNSKRIHHNNPCDETCDVRIVQAKCEYVM